MGTYCRESIGGGGAELPGFMDERWAKRGKTVSACQTFRLSLGFLAMAHMVLLSSFFLRFYMVNRYFISTCYKAT